MRLVGVSGSLRKGSYNSARLEAALAKRPPRVEVERWSGLELVPAYDHDLDASSAPFAVAELRRTFAAADAVLIATPEYNASIPGALKNALDWASRPFPDYCLRGKPVAVIGASTGPFGAVWAGPGGARARLRVRGRGRGDRARSPGLPSPRDTGGAVAPGTARAQSKSSSSSRKLRRLRRLRSPA